MDKLNVKHVKKKIYVVKKILGTIFLKFFSLNLILIYILNYFYHFRLFSYYKKCAYLKEVIRRDSDQCAAYCSHLCRSSSLVEGMLIEEELKKSSNHAVQFGLQLLLQLVLLAYLSNKRQNITYGPATRTLKCYSETKS